LIFKYRRTKQLLQHTKKR